MMILSRRPRPRQLCATLFFRALIYCVLTFAAFARPYSAARAQISTPNHHAPQINYAKTDEHALKAPDRVGADIVALADYLTRPFQSEQEKTRAIFCWITHNISYDHEYFDALIRLGSVARIIKNKESDYRKRQKAFAQAIDSLNKLGRKIKITAPAKSPKPKKTVRKNSPEANAATTAQAALDSARKAALAAESKELAAVKAREANEHKSAMKKHYAEQAAAKATLRSFYAQGRHIQTAAVVLKRRIGVCAGCSALFHALASKAGLQSADISGSVKTGNDHINEWCG
jgi:transglutaminase/protease-like cytokinesis protein 3